MYKIYLITNLKNKKQYVGITKFSLEERFSQHIKRGFLLTEAIRKYGQKTFSIELVEQVESAERVYELEQYYIKQYDTKVPNGYNLTDGGDGISGLKHNDETKEKIKLSRIGKPSNNKGKTWKQKNKRPVGFIRGEYKTRKDKGKKFTSEIKDKMKANNLDKYGVENPMHREEVKEKLKQTILEIYGVEHFSQSDDFKEKFKNTCLEKYGVEHVSQTEEFREKVLQTFIKWNPLP